MQVESKPTLKNWCCQRLKFTCDEQLSSFAFEYNLLRYNKGSLEYVSKKPAQMNDGQGGAQAGVYTRPLFGSTSAVFVTETTQRIPLKVLTSSRAVDECRL